jgi:DNA-binding MarR family transcriptional regulator
LVANLRRVPSPKRKTGRNPLQRLSDQRRSLALAGLAVGAVFSAAIFHRKRRGGEAEFGQPMPPTESSATQPESGPPAAVEIPPPAATAPEVAATATVATAAQADPEAAATAESGISEPKAESASAAESEPEQPSPEEASSSLSDPATGELSAEEASILAVLAQHGRSDDDRTVIAVATSLERESADVSNVLRKLNAEGVVAGELYTATGDKIWSVTERGVRRLGAQH